MKNWLRVVVTIACLCGSAGIAMAYPVTGTVVKVNSPLGDSPEYLNDDPYDEGWMIQVEMDNAADLASLMSADDYASFVAEQGE